VSFLALGDRFSNELRGLAARAFALVDVAPRQYRKVDAESGDEVDSADIIKGYEVGKGDYIELDPEELELSGRLDPSSTNSKYRLPSWLSTAGLASPIPHSAGASIIGGAFFDVEAPDEIIVGADPNPPQLGFLLRIPVRERPDL